MKYSSYQGKPIPLGASKCSEGYNFALFSKNAKQVSLSIFDAKKHLLDSFLLDSQIHKTGDIWHIQLDLPPEAVFYAYQVLGSEEVGVSHPHQTYLLDPYALEVSSHSTWGGFRVHGAPQFLGVLPTWGAFDWQGVQKPHISHRDLIIYEMHVRGFTVDPSSKVKHPGTYAGVIEKIPYLLELGVNAVELLPVHEFDETEVRRFKPSALQRLSNYWGYSTLNFFSPMSRYALSSRPGMPVTEFKTMVRELHRHGIEVILDVVFNHTAEGNQDGPFISFKGIDPDTYYFFDKDGTFSNYTGCGNTLHCNHPVVRRLIIDSLRYWVIEMQVDGFRFDLASVLQRGAHGHASHFSALIEEITEDPLLSNVKLIAEPWDAVGLYQVGGFAPQSPRWLEWNDKYRDGVRKFIKGTPDPSLKGNFITRICGSQDLYWNRSPLNSLNFITAHDGFTLRDLVSYNEKHNQANGEENRDGHSSNESWNCGAEGPSKDEEILNLREKQMRNFHLALMLSLGTPMLLMGDEYGHTRKGNNNSWCQDNQLNWFLWDQLEKNAGFFRFYKKLIHFRKEHPLMRRDGFLNPEDIICHGVEPLKPDWHSASRLVAFTWVDSEQGNDLYIIFNADSVSHKIHLPPARNPRYWQWVVNTANPPPSDFYDEAIAPRQDSLEFVIEPFSACVLESK